MAICKDCLCYDVCEARIATDENYPERNYTKNNNCSNFKNQSKFISTGINKSEGECINFEKLICPYCYKEIEWDTFYSDVDKYDILSTDAAVSNDYSCPHCKKTMRVSLDVLILSEQKELCQE